jgi:hypothetical protein
MSLSDWDAIWKRQAPPVGAAADVESLRSTFDAQSRKRANNLAIRDYSESLAGLFVVIVFGFAWWKMGSAGWPIGISIVITACVSLRFVFERLRIRRARLGPDASMMAKLDSEISELRYQLKFQRGLFKWYLVPIMVAWAISILSTTRLIGGTIMPGLLKDILHNPTTAFVTILYFAVIVPFCFWIAYRNISRGIRLGILPRLEELEKLRRNVAGAD